MVGSDKHEGLGTGLYWWFCIILCVLTALEWAVFEYRETWGVSTTLLVVSLSILSIVKFTMVVGWYMHLRYDPRLLKNLFILSLLLMIGVGAGLVVLMI
ncbi:MAG: cytochrome C oxidase subunit IV family protein [Oligoflexus sp.]